MKFEKEFFEFTGFEWDDEKAEINWHKHRVDFTDAQYVFARFVAASPQFEEGEDRWLCIGTVDGRELLVIITERDYEDGTYCRLISARRASKIEKKRYHEIFDS